jgi:hypothetical protein
MTNFHKMGRVSIWLGIKQVDPNVDLLKNLCGVDSYDLDDQKVSTDATTQSLQPIESLLEPVSYSNSFSKQATNAAQSLNIRRALYALCQFDFAYDPQSTSSKIADDPIFIGHFSWSDSEDA